MSSAAPPTHTLPCLPSCTPLPFLSLSVPPFPSPCCGSLSSPFPLFFMFLFCCEWCISCLLACLPACLLACLLGCLFSCLLACSRDRKSMSVLCRTRGDKAQNRLFVKGAPEMLVKRCTKARQWYFVLALTAGCGFGLGLAGVTCQFVVAVVIVVVGRGGGVFVAVGAVVFCCCCWVLLVAVLVLMLLMWVLLSQAGCKNAQLKTCSMYKNRRRFSRQTIFPCTPQPITGGPR